MHDGSFPPGRHVSGAEGKVDQVRQGSRVDKSRQAKKPCGRQSAPYAVWCRWRCCIGGPGQTRGDKKPALFVSYWIMAIPVAVYGMALDNGAIRIAMWRLGWTGVSSLFCTGGRLGILCVISPFIKLSDEPCLGWTSSVPKNRRASFDQIAKHQTA